MYIVSYRLDLQDVAMMLHNPFTQSVWRHRHESVATPTSTEGRTRIGYCGRKCNSSNKVCCARGPRTLDISSPKSIPLLIWPMLQIYDGRLLGAYFGTTTRDQIQSLGVYEVETRHPRCHNVHQPCPRCVHVAHALCPRTCHQQSPTHAAETDNSHPAIQRNSGPVQRSKCSRAPTSQKTCHRHTPVGKLERATRVSQSTPGKHTSRPGNHVPPARSRAAAAPPPPRSFGPAARYAPRRGRRTRPPRSPCARRCPPRFPPCPAPKNPQRCAPRFVRAC
mmetsp:Transcript_128727/g.412377  ORF Transcript_128727/g.412377 Transcript_128727/m.412377 type:complete len:278 (-) Transcript_128727:40-873(-)